MHQLSERARNKLNFRLSVWWGRSILLIDSIALCGIHFKLWSSTWATNQSIFIKMESTEKRKKNNELVNYFFVAIMTFHKIHHRQLWRSRLRTSATHQLARTYIWGRKKKHETHTNECEYPFEWINFLYSGFQRTIKGERVPVVKRNYKNNNRKKRKSNEMHSIWKRTNALNGGPGYV